jgi:subtilisin family serine protease
MNPLDIVNLTALMELTSGKPEIKVGLIDGPVVINHPDLVSENIREIPGTLSGTCAQAASTACMHGTFVAGILCAKRNSLAPAICPNCTLLVRPIFAETASGNGQNRSGLVETMPSATPDELAAAIIDCLDAGAGVINLSAALAQPSSRGERKLEEALDYAARRGAIIVAAAGNQGTIGSSAITRHPWVIPVVACDLQGRPISYSNLGSSIGRRGLSAPGDVITSLGANGKPLKLGGTSVAAPFVTGAVALLWSEFPNATAAQVKLAVTQAYTSRRATVVPPLLDAWAAYQVMVKAHSYKRK